VRRDWVDWFNNRQLLEPIGNIPPAEAEERFYAKQEQRPVMNSSDADDKDMGTIAPLARTLVYERFPSRRRASSRGK
jgi:hypothetical protein